MQRNETVIRLLQQFKLDQANFRF
ncbi:MAG: hypothetical protein ACIWVG_12640 [Gloeotrichia echinulata HAB0833]